MLTEINFRNFELIKVGDMRVAILSLAILVSVSCTAQDMMQTKHEDGSVKSEYVKVDKNTFAVTNYYHSGEVKETGFFRNEVPDGKWVTYSKDGSKTAELSYENGKKHGEFRVWDAFTNAYMEVHYVNGEIITADRYVKQADFASTEN
jgi:hypothetical protein